ncbi:MAG: TIGR02147 family protein [Myxococcota bacterium]
MQPELYSYLSYREYLGDWYAARKAADSRFSHRLFARRAGVSSPSLLNEVIGGRRNLTPRTLEGFVHALELDDEAAAFFAALVDLDQAVTDEERNAAFRRVESSRRFRGARRIEGAGFRYLSNWFYPAIRELALCGGFQADPEWIRKQLQPPITAAQAREALDALFEIGLLVQEGDTVRAAEVSVATPHRVSGLAANNYHKQMLERASDSIEGASPDERHLLGVTVAIPASLVPELKRELNAMQERLLHLCDDAVDDAERVYQVELCLVPLTRGNP